MTCTIGPLWHVGVVANDPEPSIAEFTLAAGMTRSATQGQDVWVETSNATDCGWVFRIAPSGESPDWEIAEQVDGGHWSGEHTCGIALCVAAHWSSELDRDGASFEVAGPTGEARDRCAKELVGFEYFASPSGIQLELGARYTEAPWNEWVSGGQYDLAS